MTVSVARLASQTKLWPLYEAEEGFAKLTRRPDVEPVERYLESHGRARKATTDVGLLQRFADRYWKQLADGMLL